MSLQDHGKLWRHKAETLKAKGRRELKGERAPRVGEKQGMAATRGMNPFLKADSLARAPKRHGQSLPRCAPGFPSYDTGPGLTCHTAGPLVPKREEGESPRPTVKKVNRRTRSVLPPRGSAPPRLRCNQWSNLWHGGPGPHVMHLARRFLCAEKANRRMKSVPPSAVVRLFAPAETDSPVSGIGAWAHESSSLGAGSCIQVSRTTTRTNIAPPRGCRRR
jgi:hypothetical protein